MSVELSIGDSKFARPEIIRILGVQLLSYCPIGRFLGMVGVQFFVVGVLWVSNLFQWVSNSFPIDRSVSMGVQFNIQYPIC